MIRYEILQFFLNSVDGNQANCFRIQSKPVSHFADGQRVFQRQSLTARRAGQKVSEELDIYWQVIT